MTHQDAHELLTLALQLTATACEKKPQDPSQVIETFVTCSTTIYEQYQSLRDSKIPGK
jgi:hypothetical protein